MIEKILRQMLVLTNVQRHAIRLLGCCIRAWNEAMPRPIFALICCSLVGCASLAPPQPQAKWPAGCDPEAYSDEDHSPTGPSKWNVMESVSEERALKYVPLEQI